MNRPVCECACVCMFIGFLCLCPGQSVCSLFISFGLLTPPLLVLVLLDVLCLLDYLVLTLAHDFASALPLTAVL